MIAKRTYKIGIVQAKIEQGKPDENIPKGIRMIREAAAKGASIVCLPELFNTGYFITSQQLQALAEPQDGAFVQTLSKLAEELGIYIIAGYCESCDIPGRIYNSAIFIDDKGKTIGNMRKVYVWAQEKMKFREGDKFPVYDTPLGKIGIMICADIEYPEPSRIAAMKGAELVFIPAVWSIPAARRWDVDLAGNALFNLMYTAGSNPVGEGVCGTSQVFGPDGEPVAVASKTEEEVIIAEINRDYIVEVRARIPYWNDFKENTFSMNAVETY